MRRLPQAMAVIVILGTAGLSSRLLSPSVDPQGSQAQPAAGVSVAATAGAAHAAANPDGTPDGTDGCVDAPGAIAGLWFVKNNRKHKPEFFMRRVGELAIQVAKSGLDMAFFHDGREGTNDIVHAKYEQNHPAGQYWDNTVALDDLPYQAWAKRLDPTCPSKWGKPLPRGSLQEFNKIWLSKIWACWHMAVEKRATELCHTSWIWLDAGLSDPERKRAMQSVKEIGKPSPGAVYMQMYPPGMLKAPAHYFRNRCPVVHRINAKVIWSDRAGFTLLRAAFDECLAKLAMALDENKEAGCECFDEETVLTHMYDHVGQCAKLETPLPELRPIQVIDPNKKA